MTDDAPPVFFELDAPEDPPVGEIARSAFESGTRFRARDGFEVLLGSAVLSEAYRWGRRCAPLEGYALLAGRRLRDDLGEYVFIDGFVPDDDAIASRAAVRTTPRSEAITREKLSAAFPTSEPIGWLHTHPNYGAFFSSVDRKNQSSWREPFQLGLVVDPIRHEAAMFRGPRSEEMSRMADARAMPSITAAVRSAAPVPHGPVTSTEPIQPVAGLSSASTRPPRPSRGLVSRARRLVRDVVPPFAVASVVGAIFVTALLVGRVLAVIETRLARIEAVLEGDRATQAEPSLVPGEGCGIERREHAAAPLMCTQPTDAAPARANFTAIRVP